MRLLDLFCGAGGAAEGYRRAGFTDIVGVDHHPQPRYPFSFEQADALTYPLAGFDAVHASPPCQAHSRLTNVHGRRDQHPDLIPATRQRLRDSGLPYVIENVPGAPLVDPVTLCGSMFGLAATDQAGIRRQLRRHRLFETSFWILTPPCQHTGQPIGVYGNGGPQRPGHLRGYMGGAQERRDAMGIDWMTTLELSQAIPPAYTEYLGLRLAQMIESPQ